MIRPVEWPVLSMGQEISVHSLGDLVERAAAATERSERPDLGRRLAQTQRRLEDPHIRVVVVGEFKQGKSLLVNALVNAPVCSVDDDVATAVPTVVSHGDEPSATLVLDEGRTTVDATSDPAPERRRVPLESLAGHVSESASLGEGRRLAFAEVELPRRVLSGGLVLVDTPGIGGLGSTHSAGTLAMLPTADAVLFVSDAAQEYSAPELDFLRQAMKLCPNVACVLTKIDAYPHWRRIAELDRVHLAGAGVSAPLLPVSSTLRLEAVRTGDQELNAESGFAALAAHLERDVVGRAGDLSQRSVVHDVMDVTEHLVLSLRTELAGLEDPGRNEQLVGDLERARDAADGLRKRTARWQQALNDGIADLTADIEYDLRDRTRAILREAEEVIDAGDPAKVWPQFVGWLGQLVAAAVKDNFVWTHERSEWLAGEVADHFRDSGGSGLPDLALGDVEGVLDPVPSIADIERDATRFPGKILIGMRGSYGGILMFGLITGVMGFALINPISVGAGVVLGTKSYLEDRDRKVKARRADAKAAVRRHIDDVVFQVGKESRDRLRQVQRLLRDHFAGVADEVHRSLSDSVRAAQRAAKTTTSDRQRRMTEVRAELGQIEALQRQTRALRPVARAA